MILQILSLLIFFGLARGGWKAHSFCLSPQTINARSPRSLTSRAIPTTNVPDPSHNKATKQAGDFSACSRSKRYQSKSPQVFKHLFRHNEDISIDCWLRCCEPREFLLSCGYTNDEIDGMASDFPQLLDLDVHGHLAPKVRFIVKTLGGGEGDLVWAEEEEFVQQQGEECDVADILSPHKLRVSSLAKASIPPEFFGLRLERHVGPRHAYLETYGLPSGQELLTAGGKRMKQFLEVCSKPPNEFAMLAMRWAAGSQKRAMRSSGALAGSAVHTAERVANFVEAFRRGLPAAAKNEYKDLQSMLGFTAGCMAELLISHGANYLEGDRHASLLHWACGTGNLDVAKSILEAQSIAFMEMDSAKVEVIINTQNTKDGATPLHWAACGVDRSYGFGRGGKYTKYAVLRSAHRFLVRLKEGCAFRE